MNKPLVFYSVAVFLGCLSSQVYTVNYLMGAAITASFLVMLFTTLNKKFFALCVCFFALGILSFFMYFHTNMEYGQNITFDCIRIVEKNDFSYIGSVRGKKVVLKGIKTDVEKGKRLKVNGDFFNETNYERGIVGSIKVKELQYLEDDLFSKIQLFKRQLYEEFKIKLGSENAGEVMSLCFGDTENLSEEQMDSYKQLGVIHAISVSGFHMAVIYKVLETAAGSAVAGPIALIYVIFSGGEPATVRAFIMILVLKSSKRLWKNYDSFSSLGLSATIILIYRPFYITDLGFLLSYLSTLGILLFYGKMRRFFCMLPKFINDSLSISLSAQCFSMPFAAMTIQYFSSGFLLGNVLLLPLYSVVVILGNLALILTKLRPAFAILSYIINLIQWIIHLIGKLLLGIHLKGIYFTYTDGIFMLVIIFCFIFTRKGYVSLKYFPLCFMLVVMFQHYYIFTEVAYVNISGVQGIIVKHQNESVIALKGKCTVNKDELKSKYHIDRIFENVRDEYDLSLSGDKKISIGIDEMKKLQIEVRDNKKSILLTENRLIYDMNKSSRYDIIEILDSKNYVSKTMFLTYWNMKRYKIIFGKTLLL